MKKNLLLLFLLVTFNFQAFAGVLYLAVESMDTHEKGGVAIGSDYIIISVENHEVFKINGYDKGFFELENIAGKKFLFCYNSEICILFDDNEENKNNEKNTKNYAIDSNVSYFDDNSNLNINFKNIHEKTITANGVSFNMIKIKGGSVTMGSGKSSHKVNVPDFYIGQVEVTQKLWDAVMNPQSKKFGNLNPVTNVTLEDCKIFVEKLSKLTKIQFSITSEAQWEYAAKGGENNFKYSGSDNCNEVAWTIENYRPEIFYVGLKRPNKYGLFDMSGNVSELCFGNIIKGGSIHDEASQCYVSNRMSTKLANMSYVGFRLVINAK